MDRTDEIRTEILRSRERGWAARLRYASSLLDRSPASAIIEDVCREMEPPVTAEVGANEGVKGITQADRERDTYRPPSTFGGQRGSEAGCYS